MSVKRLRTSGRASKGKGRRVARAGWGERNVKSVVKGDKGNW